MPSKLLRLLLNWSHQNRSLNLPWSAFLDSFRTKSIVKLIFIRSAHNCTSQANGMTNGMTNSMTNSNCMTGGLQI